MSPHAYTEDQLVEQPAMFDCFSPMGWALASSRTYPQKVTRNTNVWVDDTGLFGRETKGEVVLVSRLRTALVKLNPGVPAEAIQTAIDELTRDRSAMSLEAANREVYKHLKDGIPVSFPDREHGGQ